MPLPPITKGTCDFTLQIVDVFSLKKQPTAIGKSCYALNRQCQGFLATIGNTGNKKQIEWQAR